MGRLYTNCSTCSNISNNVPDGFNIKQSDTCPDFTIEMKDSKTGSSISFENWEVLTFLYYESCLKTLIQQPDYGSDYLLTLSGNINLCQVKIGDIIETLDCNQNVHEFMIVNSLNFTTKEITVTRGYGDSDISEHIKGTKLRFYRIYGSAGYVASKNIPEEDDDFDEDFSIIGYHWCLNDTSHRGTYYLEFKLTNGVIDQENEDYDQCAIESRTYPVSNLGYKVNII